MRMDTQVGVDVDGARYCLTCAPMGACEAERQGIGGVVFAGDLMSDTDLPECCTECGEEL